MTEEKLEKFKKFAGSWEFQMQSENIEEVLAAQGNVFILFKNIYLLIFILVDFRIYSEKV